MTCKMTGLLLPGSSCWFHSRCNLSLLSWHGFMMFAWCDSVWQLQALCNLKGPENTFIQTEEFLNRTWHWVEHSCQEHTILWEGVGKRTVHLEKGMTERQIGRRPAHTEAEAGHSSWYPSVTWPWGCLCHFLQQQVLTWCCTQDLSLHSEVG